MYACCEVDVVAFVNLHAIAGCSNRWTNNLVDHLLLWGEGITSFHMLVRGKV
jgi:hypothetical protein